ncbi:MAG: EutN/CcmL family microcompartment protein [Polyangia bacterium]
MKLCRVLGPVVATAKHPTYIGRKLLVVQPLDESGADVGSSFLAVDDVQAGRGDVVLVMQEGNGVRQLLKLGSQVPIRSLIVGIVDHVDQAGHADHAAPAERSR